MTSALSRRTLLKAGVTSAALTAGLSACGSESTPEANDPAAKAAALPDYVPFAGGATPDLRGTPDGALDAFVNYPAEPKNAWSGSPPGDGQPITALAQLNGSPPQPKDRNPFWQELNKRIGSDVQMQLIPTGTAFDAKLATLSAGDDFPNILQVGNSVPSLARFLDAKMLDLTPYLSGDKVKEYPALANIPAKYWSACIFNGKLYGFPASRGVSSSFVLYARRDLLDPADIKSFADLQAVARSMTVPKDNRWAFASNPLRYLRAMVGVTNGWRETDGKFVHSYEQEGQAEALEATRKLQEEQLLHPDVAGAQQPEQKAWFGTGKSAFYLGTYSAWPSLVLEFDAPSDAVEVLPMVGFTGGKGVGSMGGPNNNMAIIPKTAKNRIETILKFADYLASPFGSSEYLFLRHGIKDRHYKLEGSNPISLPDNASEFKLGVEYLASPPPVLFNTSLAGYAEKAHASQTEFSKNAVADLGSIYYSETASRKNPTLSKTMTNAELDIIFGRQPVSSWADAVKKWKTEGGDAIREELAAAKEQSQ